MTRRPANFQWIGFTPEQVALLDRLDFYGNNGWARNPQSETMLPILMRQAEDLGLTVDRIQEAMQSIGYSPRAVHMLARWESKRTTGFFGR